MSFTLRAPAPRQFSSDDVQQVGVRAVAIRHAMHCSRRPMNSLFSQRGRRMKAAKSDWPVIHAQCWVRRGGAASCVAMLTWAMAACTGQTPHRTRLFEPLSPAEAAVMVAEGREIAVTQCGSCHGVGQTDHSPRADAPPLRLAFERYDSSALAGNLMIGVHVGHPDMPIFHMSPRAVDSLVEYLYSIRTSEGQNP
jgi:mono/diheme cytochrome c family protein